MAHDSHRREDLRDRVIGVDRDDFPLTFDRARRSFREMEEVAGRTKQRVSRTAFRDLEDIGGSPRPTVVTRLRRPGAGHQLAGPGDLQRARQVREYRDGGDEVELSA
jgi:hypothetical protein